MDYLRKHLLKMEQADKLKVEILEAEARGDWEKLNLLARKYINQGGIPAARRFRDIFDLMDEKLLVPTCFDERVELIFYMDMVRSEFKKVQGLEPSAWQVKRLGELRSKEREINGLIENKDIGNGGIYARRDVDFKECLDCGLINVKTMTKRKIKDVLMDRNFDLWGKGFEDWWKKSSYKRQPGRPEWSDF